MKPEGQNQFSKLEFLRDIYRKVMDVTYSSHNSSGDDEKECSRIVKLDINSCPHCGNENVSAYGWLDGESFLKRDEVFLHYGMICEKCGYRHNEHVSLDSLIRNDEDATIVYDLEHVRVRLYPSSWMVGFEEIEWKDMESVGFSSLSGSTTLYFFDEVRMIPLVISSVGYKSCSFHTLIHDIAPSQAKKLLNRWKEKTERISIYLQASRKEYPIFTPAEIGVWYFRDKAKEMESKLVELSTKKSGGY